jgi:hypothetical protein
MKTKIAEQAGFFDGLTAVYLLDLLTKPLVFMTIVVLLMVTVFRRSSGAGLKGLASIFSEVKVGDISLKFQQLEERVAVAEGKAESAQEQLDDLTVDRKELDAPLEAFDSDASSKDLDALASALRPIASAIENPADYEQDLLPGATEEKVFGAAIVARSQPKARFAEPLAAQIDHLAADKDLRGFRLKTVYRLVMALETVLRTDNRLSRRKLNAELRRRISDALESLAASRRCREDDQANGTRGIGARIQRTLSLI